MIDQVIQELGLHLGYLAPEQIKAIKSIVASYALAAVMDSQVRTEAKNICLDAKTD